MNRIFLILRSRFQMSPRLINLFIFLSILLYLPLGLAHQPYFICGPDEDACPEDGIQYCFCIPYHEQEANQAYCFDFKYLKCTPLSNTPNCPSSFIFSSQAECLALIFQSQAQPGCKRTTYEVCQQHHAYMCDEHGQLNSCHKQL